MQLAWRAFGRRKMAICASSPPHSHHHNTCNFSSAPHGPSLSATNSFTLLHTPCTVARCPVGVPRATAVGTSIIRQSVSSARFMRDTTAVAGIRQFSSLQNKAGKLFVSGWSNCGALGLGKDMVKAKQPTEIPLQEPVIDVSCGKKFTVFVTASGKVYSMGDNNYGELGNPSAGKAAFEPILAQGLDGIKMVKIAAGQHHVLALSDIGEVYSWGWGGSGTPGAGVGALGHGDKSSQPAPKRIENLNGEKITNISCGAKHSVALSQDGTMFTWGHGEQGRLGHGNNTDFLQPEPISDSPKMKWIECGEHFTAAIGLDGTLYTWGKNKVGELGLEGMSVFAQESSPTSLDRDECFKGASVIHIGCGHQHCVAVTEDAVVYVWGAAGFSYHTPHRLNLISAPSDPSHRIKQVFAGNSYSAAITEEGKVYTWGRNKVMMEGLAFVGTNHVLGHPTTSSWLVEPTTVESLSNVKSVACGNLHTAFIAG